MVGERPDVGALRLRRAHRRPNDPERGQTTRESGRELGESSKSGCSTDPAIAAIGSKSRILNSLLGGRYHLPSGRCLLDWPLPEPVLVVRIDVVGVAVAPDSLP